MWNCNWGYYHWPWGFFHGHGILAILFGILLLIASLFFITYVIRLLTVKNNDRRDRNDSLAILKSRYASGAISQEEFLRIRDILNN